MKLLGKIIVLLCLMLGNCVSAETIGVLVLPVDLFKICANNYCFSEPSEVFSNDIIDELNKSGKILSPNLYDVRRKILQNSVLKSDINNALNKYRASNIVDFAVLKKAAELFQVNSVLMLSSSVVSGQKKIKRSIWEVLEVATAFETTNSYVLETNVVLLDNVNNGIMYSGKYNRSIGNGDSRFWAKDFTEAASILEKINLYSREVISKTVSQNVVLRYFPKVAKPVVVKKINKPDDVEFKPNPLGNVTPKIIQDKDSDEVKSETIYSL